MQLIERANIRPCRRNEDRAQANPCARMPHATHNGAPAHTLRLKGEIVPAAQVSVDNKAFHTMVSLWVCTAVVEYVIARGISALRLVDGASLQIGNLTK
jgi:hypothetical protein